MRCDLVNPGKSGKLVIHMASARASPVSLDEARTIAYLVDMTGRLLLALLALMASLTGQIAPVQARAGGPSAVGVSAAAVKSESLSRAVRADAMARAVRPTVKRDCSDFMLAPRRDCQPPVMLGVDRAHE